MTARPARGAIDQAMEGQHAEGQAASHQQLDVRGAREDERTEGEEHAGDHGRRPAAGEVANQVVAAGER